VDRFGLAVSFKNFTAAVYIRPTAATSGPL